MEAMQTPSRGLRAKAAAKAAGNLEVDLNWSAPPFVRDIEPGRTKSCIRSQPMKLNRRRIIVGAVTA